MNTEQTDFWTGEFGADYTDRHTLNPTQLDDLYAELFGISRTAMNAQFLGERSISSILEVGCNVGNQLRCLQAAGYNRLYGIELQEYAVRKAKDLTENINIIQGSAFDIPFKDNYFDLVYTSGVLIHISPQDIDKALDEMVRVSKKYIWGFEYFADQYIEVDYRGNKGKLWKNNFVEKLLSRYSNLRLLKEQKFSYAGSSNADQMYLFEKIE